MATLMLRLKDREIQSSSITKTYTLIGRDQGCDLVIDNPSISRQHAVVQYQDGRFMVVDAGSSNGVFVRGKKVTTAPLINGADFQIGKFTVVFLAAGGVAPENLVHAEPKADSAAALGDTVHLSGEYITGLHDTMSRHRNVTLSHTQPGRRKPRPWMTLVVIGVAAVLLAVAVVLGVVS